MAKIEFKEVTVRYGATDAVRRVSLEIPDGAYCCLLGPSGCGKTSLLRALAGFVPVAGGEVLLDGTRVNGIYPGDRNLAMIFQNFALYPHLTVRANFEFPLRAAGEPAAKIAARLAAVAGMLGMEGLLDRYPRELSGGQQQRVAIGRALMRTPRAFLLDEPLGNLDAKLKVGMRANLRELHDQVGATFVHVTHDQTEALALANLLVVMNEGRIEQAGPPDALYDRPASLFVAGFVGSPPMNLLDGTLAEVGLVPTFKAAGLEVDLATVPDRERLRSRMGKRILMGIRPEHLVVGLDSPGGLRARVVVEEFAGPEVVLDLLLGPHALKVRLARDTATGRRLAGAEVRVVFPPERLLFFDPETGRRIF